MWEDPEGPYVTYADHVAALDAAVAETRLRAYTLMGASIESAIEAERPCVECVVVERQQAAEKRAVAEFLRGQIAGLELTLQALEDGA